MSFIGTSIFRFLLYERFIEHFLGEHPGSALVGAFVAVHGVRRILYLKLGIIAWKDI